MQTQLKFAPDNKEKLARSKSVAWLTTAWWLVDIKLMMMIPRGYWLISRWMRPSLWWWSAGRLQPLGFYLKLLWSYELYFSCCQPPKNSTWQLIKAQILFSQKDSNLAWLFFLRLHSDPVSCELWGPSWYFDNVCVFVSWQFWEWRVRIILRRSSNGYHYFVSSEILRPPARQAHLIIFTTLAQTRLAVKRWWCGAQCMGTQLWWHIKLHWTLNAAWSSG